MPDPNRPPSRGRSSSLSWLPRELSRLGRTPSQRAVFLIIGAVVAFLLGQWSSDDAAKGSDGRYRNVPPSIDGIPLVLDGDTLDFNGLRVRLFGMDAFERDQLCEREDGSRFDCGQAARESLIAAIANSQVTCTRRDVDMYGRMVGVCVGPKGDLSARVVDEGLALAYRRYSLDYVDKEDAARAAGRGVWRGRFEPPWDYRHRGKKK